MGRPINPNLYTHVGNLMVNLEFFYRHQRSAANGCIEWTAGRHRQGFGMCGGIRISDNKRIMTVAHRIAAMLRYGAITSDQCVIHTCPEINNLCVNPDHLIIGTHKDKSDYMIARGRAPQYARGKHIRDTRQQKRKYRYDLETMLWIRHPKTRSQAIAERLGIPLKRAYALRHGMRKNYNWIKQYEEWRNE